MTHAHVEKQVEKRPFWLLSAQEVVDELHTDAERGLTAAEAVLRERAFGPNLIEKTSGTSGIVIFLNQFKSPLIAVLVLAGGATALIGHYRDASFILIAIVVNAVLGFYQEFKAEKALTELKTYLKQRSRVIRDGKEREIDSAQIVPGDLLRLTQGDRVPADGRLIFTNDLQIDEAILTGESLPVVKSTDSAPPGAGLADQNSMVFAGTLVTQGVASAVACRTGLSTELGQIAALVADSSREDTPLQKKIKTFSIQVGASLSVLTVLIFVAGISLGYSYVDMFLTSIAVAVGSVPEGLPVAMTVILAIGVQRMARRKGVVRKLVAAEALGSTTVILTDKTGTLTQAKMALSKLLPSAHETEDRLLKRALLNANVLVENPNDNPEEWRMNGRVLETSLMRSAVLRGIPYKEAQDKSSVLSSLPFNAVNKFSVSLVREGGKHLLVFFGAPDMFIPHSTLPSHEQTKLLDEMAALARSGELVVGVATKEIPEKKDFSFAKDLQVSELSFDGLIALRDPIRPGVADAIRRVESAGIRTVIMTGDHRGTAEAVSRELGIFVGEESVLDAEELRSLSDTDLKKRLPGLRVISRVSPFDKMRVVKVFQDMGEVVAMTGDGVNDAPSIKQADIGIAMGSGTEVARDVADLVLLDDNFETIVAAVEEGRQIMHNIQKVLVYFLSSITNELMLIGGALALGLALPLNALQILWVNFFSDSFPAVAFAFERNIDGMHRHSHNLRSGLLSRLMKFLIFFIGLSTSALLFVLYWVLLGAGYPEDIVRTFIFASFGSYTLILAFSLRSLEKSIFEYAPFSNPYLVMGVGVGLALMLAAVYVPFLQSVLGTVSLPLSWLLGVAGVGLFNIVAVELGKWLFRHKHHGLGAKKAVG